MPQGMKIKINNQILNNRPTSRLASASPPAIHLNIPIKNEIIPYQYAFMKFFNINIPAASAEINQLYLNFKIRKYLLRKYSNYKVRTT